MHGMYQVRIILKSSRVRGRRPIFKTVRASTAPEAKRIAKEQLYREHPEAEIKQIKATPVF